MDATTAVRVRNLGKTYGESVAVNDLSFDVAAGEVEALLGPNGAGKTTTVEILEGHRDRDAGDVSVLGFDPATGGRAYRERIGIVLQEAGREEEFSVRELLTLYRGMYPRRRDVDEVIGSLAAESCDMPLLRAFEKLGVDDRTAAVVAALERGLLTLSEPD